MHCAFPRNSLTDGWHRPLLPGNRMRRMNLFRLRPIRGRLPADGLSVCRLPGNPLVPATMNAIDHRGTVAVGITRSTPASVRLATAAGVINGIVDLVIGLVGVAGGLHRESPCKRGESNK